MLLGIIMWAASLLVTSLALVIVTVKQEKLCMGLKGSPFFKLSEPQRKPLIKVCGLCLTWWFYLQVFQVRKVSGATSGKIFAMKVLKKVSHLSSYSQCVFYPTKVSPTAPCPAYISHCVRISGNTPVHSTRHQNFSHVTFCSAWPPPHSQPRVNVRLCIKGNSYSPKLEAFVNDRVYWLNETFSYHPGVLVPAVTLANAETSEQSGFFALIV